MINLCRIRYSMYDKNITMYDYLFMYILLLLLTRLIVYSKRVITYFNNME